MGARANSVNDDRFLGNPDLVPVDRLGDVKSNLFQSRGRYIRERAGQGGYDEVVSRISAEARAKLDRPPPLSTWLPWTFLLEVDRAITDVLMDGDVTQMQPFGARIAEYDFEKTYAHLLRMVTNVRFFIKRSPSLWNMYFRGPAGLVALGVENDRAVVLMRGGAVPRYMCRYGVTGWLESAMRFYKVRPRGIDHSRCRHDGDTECQWDVYWREL